MEEGLYSPSIEALFKGYAVSLEGVDLVWRLRLGDSKVLVENKRKVGVVMSHRRPLEF